MNKIIFPSILTLSIFSIWAIFALTIVNPILNANLPGYTYGKLCIWELVALGVSAGLAFLVIRKFGQIKFIDAQLEAHKFYGLYFSIYFFLLVAVGTWQFCLFRQRVQQTAYSIQHTADRIQQLQKQPASRPDFLPMAWQAAYRNRESTSVFTTVNATGDGELEHGRRNQSFKLHQII